MRSEKSKCLPGVTLTCRMIFVMPKQQCQRTTGNTGSEHQQQESQSATTTIPNRCKKYTKNNSRSVTHVTQWTLHNRFSNSQRNTCVLLLWQFMYKLDMSQLWWLQWYGRRRVGYNEPTDLSRFWVNSKVTESRSNFKGHTVNWY